jgi:PBP1b-binding outer membrane lipoprotein LpoB
MKLRISIIVLGAAMLLTSGCMSVKTAYNGTETSHFKNPAKVAAMNNPAGLPPVAEGPVEPDTHSANPGGTGSGSMAGSSSPETWGGALSTR